MATTLGTEAGAPQVVGKMWQGEVWSPRFEHYKFKMFYPFVDYLLSELTTRFSKNYPVFELQQVIPCVVDKMNAESVIATASIYNES